MNLDISNNSADKKSWSILRIDNTVTVNHETHHHHHYHIGVDTDRKKVAITESCNKEKKQND